MSAAMKCRHCDGTGIEPNPETIAEEMRTFRVRAGVSQATVARILGVTSAMICGLEKGQKKWNQRRVREYLRAIQEEVEERHQMALVMARDAVGR